MSKTFATIRAIAIASAIAAAACGTIQGATPSGAEIRQADTTVPGVQRFVDGDPVGDPYAPIREP